MSLSIARREVGPDAPLFVIAEIGLNHGGSVDKALALVDAAADAGASAVKLQTLAADRLVCSRPTRSRNLERVPLHSTVEFFKRFELDEAAHAAIVRLARARGLAVLSTPLYEEAVDLLESLGIDAYKIASGDLTHLPLIERVARTGKPLILSTGMSELHEVVTAVGRARANGARNLALLHCVSCYPVPQGDENLGAIKTLARTFHVPVGLSDHGTDPMGAALAVALGASLYEKHLVLSRHDDAVDAAVSATPAELAEIITTAERARRSLGDGRKTCLAAEAPHRVPTRRSLRAARSLKPGDVIQRADIVVLRPGDGLDSGHWRDLIGVRVRRPIARFDPFMAEDVPETLRKVSHVA